MCSLLCHVPSILAIHHHYESISQDVFFRQQFAMIFPTGKRKRDEDKVNLSRENFNEIQLLVVEIDCWKETINGEIVHWMTVRENKHLIHLVLFYWIRHYWINFVISYKGKCYRRKHRKKNQYDLDLLIDITMRRSWKRFSLLTTIRSNISSTTRSIDCIKLVIWPTTHRDLLL